MKIVLNRLQKAMKSLVVNAEESETKGRLTFEGLGTVLYRVGLFQNLEFIPKEGDGEKSSMSINHAKVKPERLSKEVKLITSNFYNENRFFSMRISGRFASLLLKKKIQ